MSNGPDTGTHQVPAQPEPALPFGPRLRAIRLAAELSLEALAIRVHYSRSHLSKIENGVKAPTRDLAIKCEVALGCPGKLTRLVGDRRAPSSVDPTGIDAPVTVPASPVRWPELLPMADFRRTFDSLRDLSQIAAPSAILPALTGYAHSLSAFGHGAAAPTRDALFRLAARFAEHAGWMAQELGHNAKAVRLTDWAAELARAGGGDLTAYRLIRLGDLAMYDHDAKSTIEYATLAYEHAPDSRVKGIAAQRLAHGHALAGDHDACLRALDVSGALLQHPSANHDEPLIGSSTVPDQRAMATGWCLYDLGRPDEAADILAVEVERLPEKAQRARARYGARLARCYADSGDLDLACSAALPVLTALPSLDSATIRTDIRGLAATFQRHHRHPAVKSLLPLLTFAKSGGYKLTDASSR